jgi:hypothetical protein
LTKLDGDSRGGAALSVKEVCIWIPLYIYIYLFIYLHYFIAASNSCKDEFLWP